MSLFKSLMQEVSEYASREIMKLWPPHYFMRKNKKKLFKKMKNLIYRSHRKMIKQKTQECRANGLSDYYTKNFIKAFVEKYFDAPIDGTMNAEEANLYAHLYATFMENCPEFTTQEALSNNNNKIKKKRKFSGLFLHKIFRKKTDRKKEQENNITKQRIISDLIHNFITLHEDTLQNLIITGKEDEPAKSQSYDFIIEAITDYAHFCSNIVSTDSAPGVTLDDKKILHHHASELLHGEEQSLPDSWGDISDEYTKMPVFSLAYAFAMHSLNLNEKNSCHFAKNSTYVKAMKNKKLIATKKIDDITAADTATEHSAVIINILAAPSIKQSTNNKRI